MRGKKLSLILCMLLTTTLVIGLCGCKEASASVASGSDTSSKTTQQSTKTTKNTAAKKTTTKKSEPWKNVNMRGIPKVLDTLKKDDGDKLVLVNKLHAVSKKYKPTDMVTMDNSLTTWSNLELKEDAYKAYKKMYKAAKKKGFNLKVCSAYRSYSTQKSLYNNSMKNRGKKITNVRSAYPGRSEHHTGYAIDITSASMGWGLTQDFADYADGKWINEHCSDYGFILRYPKGKTDITGYAYEPWHFRYVGVKAAKEIMEQGITLEEYLGR